MSGSISRDQEAYGKIQTGQVEKPAVCVPCPASYGTINNGSPAESEDHRGQDTTAFKRSTDNQLHSDGAEKHLIEAEDDLGKQSRTRRWSRHDVLHAKVLHVTDERTGSTRVGERIAPE